MQVYRLAPHCALCGRSINGLTALNLTKLDVLSELPAIRLGVGYRLDGRDLPSVPADLDALERVEVVYEELQGWQSDISAVCLGFFASVRQAVPAVAWLHPNHPCRLRLGAACRCGCGTTCPQRRGGTLRG